MSTLIHLAARVFNTPLLIAPQKAAIIADAIADRIGISEEGAQALLRSQPALAAPARAPHARAVDRDRSGVAVISIVGSLVSRASAIDAASGLLSYSDIQRQVQAAISDPETTSLILDLHSAGGEVFLAFETADFIHRAAQQKPIVACINAMAASAAYALAAACSTIVAAPSSVTGSVGVVLLHRDTSEKLAKEGVRPTFIFSGKHKVDGHPFAPLPDEVRDSLQAEVDTYYAMFVESVAKHRPILTTAAVRDTEAKTFIAAEALRIGLVDRIDTIDAVYSELVALHRQMPELDPSGRKPPAGFFGVKDLDQYHSDLQREHAAGVRAGLAAAMAGRIA